MRRLLIVLLVLVSGAFAAGAPARAATIAVDLSSQTMRVSSGEGEVVWPISSARRGFTTPRGSYGVQRLEVLHRSRKYHNSPMPHSIFFHGGYAIHGTYAVGALGRPASHGCIRIAPENAAVLYRIVQAEGARITITGGAPAPGRQYAARADRDGPAALAQRQTPDLRGSYWEPDATALGYDRLPDTTLNHWWMDPAGM